MIDNGDYESQAFAGTCSRSKNVIASAVCCTNSLFLMLVKTERFAQAVMGLAMAENPAAFRMQYTFFDKIVYVICLLIRRV